MQAEICRMASDIETDAGNIEEEKSRGNDMRVVLVTGASRGIGAAIAQALSGADTVTIINYNGSEARAEAVVEAIRAEGGTAKTLQCDVADFAACEAMIAGIIEEYGRIDVLVNNAGITRDTLLMRMSEEDFDAVLDTNLKGAFNCTRHAVRYMLKQKSGRIINMASVSGILGNAGQANYSASKAGLIGLTKATARELASRGITVNAIAPGFIDTEMTQVLSDKVKEAVTEQIPMKRFGKTADIAATAAFLASEAAGYITGQVIAVDGGMAM